VKANRDGVSQVSKATLKGYSPPANLRRMALLPVHSKRLAICLATCVLSILVGCGEGNDLSDDFVGPSLAGDASSLTPDASAGGFTAGTTPRVDAGAVFPVSDAGAYPAYDAGSIATADAGGSDASSSSSTDASSSVSTDAGRAVSDAGAASDGGFPWPFPDLFPANDAGAPSNNKPDGGRDVHGPCKDLNLICFDFIDMWINAECQTCNAGKGCQGCSIPFAY
jgi:hypothetical protein